VTASSRNGVRWQGGRLPRPLKIGPCPRGETRRKVIATKPDPKNAVKGGRGSYDLAALVAVVKTYANISGRAR